MNNRIDIKLIEIQTKLYNLANSYDSDYKMNYKNIKKDIDELMDMVYQKYYLLDDMYSSKSLYSPTKNRFYNCVVCKQITDSSATTLKCGCRSIRNKCICKQCWSRYKKGVLNNEEEKNIINFISIYDSIN